MTEIEITETETTVISNICCEVCMTDISDEKCANCECILIEMADYHPTHKIYCYSEKGKHLCSKECVEEYKQKIKEGNKIGDKDERI